MMGVARRNAYLGAILDTLALIWVASCCIDAVFPTALLVMPAAATCTSSCTITDEAGCNCQCSTCPLESGCVVPNPGDCSLGSGACCEVGGGPGESPSSHPSVSSPSSAPSTRPTTLRPSLSPSSTPTRSPSINVTNLGGEECAESESGMQCAFRRGILTVITTNNLLCRAAGQPDVSTRFWESINSATAGEALKELPRNVSSGAYLWKPNCDNGFRSWSITLPKALPGKIARYYFFKWDGDVFCRVVSEAFVRNDGNFPTLGADFPNELGKLITNKVGCAENHIRTTLDFYGNKQSGIRFFVKDGVFLQPTSISSKTSAEIFSGNSENPVYNVTAGYIVMAVNTDGVFGINGQSSIHASRAVLVAVLVFVGCLVAS